MMKSEFRKLNWAKLFQTDHSRPLFLLFLFFNTIQLTVNKCSTKICLCLDSNRGPLVLEATALPIEPQPLPQLFKTLAR